MYLLFRCRILENNNLLVQREPSDLHAPEQQVTAATDLYEARYNGKTYALEAVHNLKSIASLEEIQMADDLLDVAYDHVVHGATVGYEFTYEVDTGPAHDALCLTMTWEDFNQHVEATGATCTRDGDVTTATCMYAGRDNVLMGTYNHSTGRATLDLI